MCVAAIKTGRYTHAKKAKDITEVKLLLAQKQQKTLYSCRDGCHGDRLSDSSQNTSYIATELSAGTAVNEDMNIDDCGPAKSMNIHERGLMNIDVRTVDMLEQIIEHITNVHLMQTPLTPDFISALPQREKHYLVSVSHCRR